jgi:hypothetical protein
MKILKDVGLYTFLVLAGALLSGVAGREASTALLSDAELACNERVVAAEIRQGEAAEHAYNVGKEEMAAAILALCVDDGKIPLDGGVLLCELVIGTEI